MPVINIDGKEYEVPDEVSKEIDRLRKIAITAQLTEFAIAKVAVIIRSITSRRG
jgi:hypothetical protein